MTALHVLILEDRPDDAELMLHELRQSGFDPVWLRVDTEQDYLAHLSPDWDIILADYTLPQFSALRALRLLQERNLDIPFIVITGSISEEAAVECMREGATDYLLKDRLSRLGPAVARALAEKRLRDEKRRAEAALRESEERFRRLAENAQDLIYRYRLLPTRGFEYVSPSATPITGYTPEDHYADPDLGFKLVHPDDRPLLQSIAQGDFARSQAITLRWVRKDGTVIWTEQRNVPIYDEAGNLVAIEGIARDVTERKRMEQALLESERRFREMLETVELVALLLDTRGNITFCNDYLSRLLGYQREELIGQNWFDVCLPPGVRETVRSAVFGSIAAGSIAPHYENPVLTRQGEQRLILWNNTLLRDTEGKVIGSASIGEDITERKRTEEQVQAHQRFLTLLNDIATAALTAPDVHTMAQAMADRLGDLVQADACYISLWDGAQQMPLPVAASGPLRDVYPSMAAPPDQITLTRSVLRAGHTLVVEDVFNSPYITPDRAALFPTRSALGLPLIAGDQKLGAVIIAFHQPHLFTPDEIARCEHVTGHIALGMAKMQALERESQQRVLAESLRQVAVDLASRLDLDQVTDRILTHLQQVLPYDSASLFLLEDDHLRAVAGRGLPAPETVIGHEFPAADSLFQEIARLAQPIILADAQEDPRFLRWGGTDYIRGWMGVPLIVRDQVIGYMTLDSRTPGAYSQADGELALAFAHEAAIAVENARLYREAVRAAEGRAILHRASQEIVQACLDLEAVYAAIHRATAELMPCEAFVIVLHDEERQENEAVYLIDKGGRWPGQRFPADQGLSGAVIARGETLLIDDFTPDAGIPALHFGQAEPVRSILAVPLRLGDRVIGMLSAQSYQPHAYTSEDQELLEMLAAHAAAALDNARLFQEMQRRLNQLSALYTASLAFGQLHTPEAIGQRVVQATEEALGWQRSSIWLVSESGQDLHLLAHSDMGLSPEALQAELARVRSQVTRVGQGICGWVAEHGQAVRTGNAKSDPRYIEGSPATQSELCVPLQVGGRTIGSLNLESPQPNAFSEIDERILTTLASQAAIAIDNARLLQDTRRHVERLSALRTIDLALTGSMDLRLTLNILLDQVTSQLNVDAADVLLLQPHIQTLEYAAGRGFRTPALQHTRLRVGNGYAGQAALERRIIGVADLHEYPNGLTRSPLLASEGFVAYYAAPLLAKGEVKGVLEIFHRAPLAPDAEWFEFLDMLTRQAAIAIDNASLFANLQRSNVELTLAYDSTLEGWARAVDLRDRETEDHSLRVAEMTVRLSRALGVTNGEVVHVRRGALLHDIGKIGVPDAILFKPGPLTPEEWEIMRQHPQWAYEMLSPITFLRPALDIPYCHHEKWDGTGYPRGLKGEAIPLAARIFALVDVWDAVRSPRPYRPAWPDDKALDYIREQSGQHFDPQVVEAFLRLEV